jgi:predicted HTH transcriptional regulator
LKTWDELLTEIYKGEKIDMECKRAENNVPDSVYETYSSFANTKGGIIVLGVDEDTAKSNPKERFVIRGVTNPKKLREDFWNTINSKKVNVNVLVDDDVYVVERENISLLVIEVPKADYTMRPVHIKENPFKGTFKRNHEGDYHAKEYEVRAMIRDQSSEGNDFTILEGYTMDDIDADTLERYRIMFNGWNPEHVWRELPDKEFLEMLGGYRRNRRDHVEGLTVAGLLMFGTGLAIRDRFDNILMDYRDETGAAGETRWVDRVTYDGTWENNLFNFFRKVMPKLTEDLAVPFVLENQQRVNDTPVHKAVREAFVNMIIHSDYRMDAGVLKVIKFDNGFCFSNPGNLKLPKEQIYRGGDSKARNPHMQTMLRMVGFGDNAGSGFPEILKVWSDNGWEEPELFEDTILNQVTLTLRESAEKSAESAEKSAESAEKSAESAENDDRLSERYMQILSFMDEGTEYSTDEVADHIGLKGPRTRQLLNELVDMGRLTATATTKNRRYIKKVQ